MSALKLKSQTITSLSFAKITTYTYIDTQTKSCIASVYLYIYVVHVACIRIHLIQIVSIQFDALTYSLS